jgi:predicted transcriptional regulator of viral defense system
VTPENLSRAFAKLRREGLLERLAPRRFRIPSLAALRRVADGD